MIKKSVEEIKAEQVELDGAKGVGMRVLFSEADGAPNFNFRVFDIEPGGQTPHHTHPYEHETFILEGEAEVFRNGTFVPVQVYDAVFIEPNEEHYFRNVGKTRLRMICIVPQPHGYHKPVQPGGETSSCGS